MRKNMELNSQRHVDTQELTMSSWLDHVDQTHWAKSGRVGIGEARKAAIEMMWRHGMEQPQDALAFAQNVCDDKSSSPMEARLAGVAVLSAWTVQGKALPWMGTEHAVGSNEGMAWQNPCMDCGLFDIILCAQPEPCIKTLAMAAFRALVAGYEWQEESSSGANTSTLEGMHCDAAWVNFDSNLMRYRLESRSEMTVQEDVQDVQDVQDENMNHPQLLEVEVILADYRLTKKTIWRHLISKTLGKVRGQRNTR